MKDLTHKSKISALLHPESVAVSMVCGGKVLGISGRVSDEKIIVGAMAVKSQKMQLVTEMCWESFCQIR